MLGTYTAVLPVLKEYVCLFQSSECLVHRLHDEQEKVFRKFVTMFVQPEMFADLNVHELKNAKILDVSDSNNHQALREMFVGASAKKAIKSVDKERRLKFLKMVQSAYVACGRVLQVKLPLNNKLLMAMSVLDPACHHSQKQPSTVCPNLLEMWWKWKLLRHVKGQNWSRKTMH